MKQVTLSVPDKKYPFFMELVKSLGFVKKVQEGKQATKEEIMQGLKDAVEEVKLIKAGKMKGVPLNEFLDEL